MQKERIFMKRIDYKNYIWYPLTDEEYWAEEFPEEFPGCYTLIAMPEIDGNSWSIYNRDTAFMGWGSMAKRGNFKFMIIEKPKEL